MNTMYPGYPGGSVPEHPPRFALQFDWSQIQNIPASVANASALEGRVGALETSQAAQDTTLGDYGPRISAVESGKANASHTHPWADVSKTGALPGDIGAAPAVHSHDDRYYTEGEVDTRLAGKSDTGHTHTRANITDFAHTHPWADVSKAGALPSDIGAAAAAHSHPIADVTGLQLSLDGKAAAAHTHPLADLNATGTRDGTTFLRGDGAWALPPGGGGSTLAVKEGDGTPNVTGVTSIEVPNGSLTDLSGGAVRLALALASHNHAAADINSGTLADARLSTNVPLKSAANVFSAPQRVQGTAAAVSQAFQTNFTDTGGGTALDLQRSGARRWALNLETDNALTLYRGSGAAGAEVYSSAFQVSGSTGVVNFTQRPTVGGANLFYSNDASSANVAAALVQRDASGNFAAGAITGATVVAGGAPWSGIGGLKLQVGGDADAANSQATFALVSASNPNRRLRAGVYGAGSYSYLQSTEDGVAAMPLLLQPQGGPVLVNNFVSAGASAGEVVLGNAKALRGVDAAGTGTIRLISTPTGYSGVQLGDNSIAVVVGALSLAQVAGTNPGDLLLGNGKAIRGANAAGTGVRFVIGLDSADLVQIGATRTGAAVPANFAAANFIRLRDATGLEVYVPCTANPW